MSQMFDEVIKLLQDILHDKILPTMNKCYELKEKASNKDIVKQLDDKYMILDAQLNRGAICLDILMGHAFTIKDDVTRMTVVIPEDQSTARLVAKAEEIGARVTNPEGSKHE